MRRDGSEKNRVQQKLVNAGKYEQRDYTSVYEEYIRKATPGEGKIIIEEGRTLKNREEQNMNMIHQELGGDIIAQKESTTPGKKNPDYKWKGSFWEEQEPIKQSRNAVDQNVHEGIRQIRESDNPGGIVLDVGESEMPITEIHEITLHRLRRSANCNCDVMLVKNGEIVDIVRYKK